MGRVDRWKAAGAACKHRVTAGTSLVFGRVKGRVEIEMRFTRDARANKRSRIAFSKPKLPTF